MPRWLFFILLAVGVGIGVYLRHRQTTGSVADGASTNSADTSYQDSAGVMDPNADPSLAGVGIATQPAGSVVPVSTPYIPEGLTEIIGTLSSGLVDVATSYPANAVEQPVTVAPVTVPSTGGGMPISRPKVTAPSRGRPVNRNKSNPRSGQSYRVIKNYKNKKGTWHVYAGGRAVRVG